MNNELRTIIENAEHGYDQLLHLTANENVLSPLAERALSSSLSARYCMSNNNGSTVATFGRNAAYKSLIEFDELYKNATDVVNRLLSAEYSTLRCLTGAHAMMCVLLSITKPGDTVMTVPSNQGGHFCTNGILEISGRRHVDTVYDFRKLTFDVENIAMQCRRHNVKVIYLDTSVYLQPHPISQLRARVGKDVKIVYDASHTLGLIMGGAFQNPLNEGADIISANTHKTFPGPHKAIVAFKDRHLGEYVEKQILKNFVSSTQTNILLSLIVAIFEMDQFGKEYARKIVHNANLLAKELGAQGLEVRKVGVDYTKSHQVHVYTNLSREDTVNRFLASNISLGTSGALGDRLFIRLGVQEITRRGYDDKDIKKVAFIISEIMKNNRVMKDEVNCLVSSHGSILYGFDQ